MKTTRLFLLLILAAGIFTSSCEDLLGDLLKFDSEWYSIEFTIEPTDELGDLVFKSEEVEANVDSLFEENGVSADNLKSAKVSDAKATIITDGYNFDPVTKVELFIESPNLGSTRLAWLDTVPRGVTMIELDLNQDDLQGYLLEDKFTLTASGTLISKVDKPVDLEAKVRFLIRGGLAQ